MVRKFSSSGFTLLEIMVALLLTGVIFSILFGVYAQTLDVAADVEQGQRAMRMLRLGTERIRVDLLGVTAPSQTEKEQNATGAEQPELPPFRLRDVRDLNGEDPVFMEFSSVNLLAFSDRFPHRETVRVAYLLRERSLVRRQVVYSGLKGDWPVQEVELVEGVRELNLSCVGPDGQTLVSWPPEGEDLPLIPELIRFTLVLGRDGEPVRRVAFTVRPQWWGEQNETNPATP